MNEVLNPNPPKPHEVMAKDFCYKISSLGRRGGPGGSFDQYHVELVSPEGIRVDEKIIYIMVSKDEKIPLEQIFLTRDEAEKMLPADEKW